MARLPAPRAAYVMWPPADGGKQVCDALGELYQEGKVAFGLVAKKYGDAWRDRTVFVRDERGILKDRTQQYKALSGAADDSEALRDGLATGIRAQWQAGASFAASNGSNGLHARRFELPEMFHEKSRAWFDKTIALLLPRRASSECRIRGESDIARPKPTPRYQNRRQRKRKMTPTRPKNSRQRKRHERSPICHWNLAGQVPPRQVRTKKKSPATTRVCCPFLWQWNLASFELGRGPAKGNASHARRRAQLVLPVRDLPWPPVCADWRRIGGADRTLFVMVQRCTIVDSRAFATIAAD